MYTSHDVYAANLNDSQFEVSNGDQSEDKSAHNIITNMNFSTKASVGLGMMWFGQCNQNLCGSFCTSYIANNSPSEHLSNGSQWENKRCS